MGTPNPTKMESGRRAMPVGMSAVVVLLSMALVLSMSLPSEAAGSSTAGLSKWGSGLQTRIRAGERRLLSNSTTNYTTTSANSMVTTAATTTTTPAPTAKKFEVKFTVSLPYSKADFTADKQTKFKEAVASAAGGGATKDDVTLKITEARRRAGKINVEVTIKVATREAANTMAAAITADKLNEKLKAAGLEEATMVSKPTVAEAGAALSNARPAASPIVAPVVAAVAALIASAGFMRTT